MPSVSDVDQKPLVLVIEDNETNLAQRVRALEKRGCRVCTARTLAEAEQLLETVSPDLILTDINLAGSSEQGNRDGLTVARLARDLHDAEVPIAAYSGAYRDVDLSAEDLGLFDLSATKPRSTDRLFERVASRLRLTRVAWGGG